MGRSHCDRPRSPGSSPVSAGAFAGVVEVANFHARADSTKQVTLKIGAVMEGVEQRFGHAGHPNRSLMSARVSHRALGDRDPRQAELSWALPRSDAEDVAKDSSLRCPDPESSAARRPAAAVLSQDSCSDSAHASSSHVRFSGESGAHPGRESGAHAKNRTESGALAWATLSLGIVPGRLLLGQPGAAPVWSWARSPGCPSRAAEPLADRQEDQRRSALRLGGRCAHGATRGVIVPTSADGRRTPPDNSCCRIDDHVGRAETASDSTHILAGHQAGPPFPARSAGTPRL